MNEKETTADGLSLDELAGPEAEGVEPPPAVARTASPTAKRQAKIVWSKKSACTYRWGVKELKVVLS